MTVFAAKVEVKLNHFSFSNVLLKENKDGKLEKNQPVSQTEENRSDSVFF